MELGRAITRLRKILDQLSVEDRPVAILAVAGPRDPTARERMQRLRNKKRNSYVTRYVTVTRNSLSKSSPPDPPSKALTSRQNHFRTEAVELLNFLNLKANRSFRPVETTLRLIAARLNSGVSVQDCKGVIARQVREWKDTEMVKYLRPETLFNATKFESYLGQKRAEPDEDPSP